MVQVLSSVLLWNFAFTKQLDKLPDKVKRDFVPTLINGDSPCLVYSLTAESLSAVPYGHLLNSAFLCQHDFGIQTFM